MKLPKIQSAYMLNSRCISPACRNIELTSRQVWPSAMPTISVFERGNNPTEAPILTSTRVLGPSSNAPAPPCTTSSR